MPYWIIFKQCFPQCFNVFFTYFVTLTIFPAVLGGMILKYYLLNKLFVQNFSNFRCENGPRWFLNICQILYTSDMFFDLQFVCSTWKPYSEFINFCKSSFLKCLTIFITNSVSTQSTVIGHKSLSTGSFLKQNYPKYRLCERDMGGSYIL